MSGIKLELEALDENNNYSLGKIDISKYLLGDSAISKIKSSIDNSDFVVGVFSFSSCKIKLVNRNGIFNLGSGGLFPFERNNARVTISLIKKDNSISKVFEGLIDEIATRDNPLSESITITVTSIDSIFKKTIVQAGAVRIGQTFKEAIIGLLSNNFLLNFIEINEDKINLDYNGVIESVESFANKSTSEVFNNILVASNSILYIDNNREVIVTPRVVLNKVVSKNFYGNYDQLDRKPKILNIKNVNTGLHRAINQIRVNNNYYQDHDYIAAFGLKSKDITVEFVSDIDQLRNIANNLINKYKVPKSELIIAIPLEESVDLKLTDIVTIYIPKKIIPFDRNENFSRVGIDNIGEARLSGTIGSYSHYSQKGFIVYEKIDNPNNFTSELKIRELGTTQGDSHNYLFPAKFGIARFGRSRFAQENVEIYSRKFGKAKFGRSRFAV